MKNTQRYRHILRFPQSQIVGEVFKHEGFIRKRVNELRNDTPHSDRLAVQGHAFISNPTENQALRNITPIRKLECDDGYIVYQPEKWLKVIDGTYNFCRDKATKQILRAWIDGNLSVIRLSIDLEMSKTSIYDIRTTLQNYAVALAAQYGLIDLTHKKTN